jgi:RNA polymerase sigma factor (sigma-70 family)
MSAGTTPSLVRELGSLFDGDSVAGLTDRQLLERFNDRRDATGEIALAALVARHGPMVLHVCRQLLGDRHHAEDAFQAVFLVLARKARSIRDPDLLGNWLYGVALRTARKARVQLIRRRKHEEGDAMSRPGVAIEPMVEPAEPAVLAREQAEILHREIDRLPSPFRLPVVLCYLEGLTLDEAARRLKCPAGTVRSRLARACAKLRRALTRRGVALSAAGLAAALSSRSAGASVSSTLRNITTKAAMNFAAGPAAAPAATALAQAVLRSMVIHKLIYAALTLAFLGAVAGGVRFIAQVPERQARKPDLRLTTENSARGRMFVVGRVLDPDGKPVPDALVLVYAAFKQVHDGPFQFELSSTGVPQTDASGRFRLDAIRTSSSIHEETVAVAIAPGFGAGWVDLDPDADQPTADITLRPEQVIQGRLFDIHGRPIRGVRISVETMGRLVRDPEGDPDDDAFEGPAFVGLGHVKDVPAWPHAVLTDAEGRFNVRGTGRNLRVVLLIDDPRFALQRINVDTDGAPSSKPVVVAVKPARIIVGRVLAADTEKPIANAVVTAFGGNFVETDVLGRFRARAESSDRYVLGVFAPPGQPYLDVRTEEAEWPKGAIEHRVDLVLPRGVVIRGKVTEEGSGRPIPGTMLGYLSRPSRAPQFEAGFGRARAGPDGSFELAVSPKSNHLIALGPSEDYVLQEAGERMIQEGGPGGRRLYAHAFIAYDREAGGDARNVHVVLRRSSPVKGRVIDPKGQPVQEALMVSRILLMSSGLPSRSWQGDYHGHVRNARFELHGLATDRETTIIFLEPERKLGTVVNLSAKSGSGGPITVRLDPCGKAKARLVDPAGKPIAGHRDPYLIGMVVTPGPSWLSRDQEDEGRLEADQDYLCRIDRINYLDGSISDTHGTVTFPALIPGATYRIQDSSDEDGKQLRRTFTVKPDETLDLGDILIQKPQAR